METKMSEQNEELMLLQTVEEIERLEAMVYDDSPWTRAELEALAWERVKDEEWDEYDQGAGKQCLVSSRCSHE